MVDIKIKMKSIDYGKSFESLLPVALEKCKAMETGNLFIRFFQKMDDCSAAAMLGILEYLPAEACNELLCSMVDLYSAELTDKLNQMLQSQGQKPWIGRHIKIGSLALIQEDSLEMVLMGKELEVDYGKLLQEAQVKGLVDGMAKKLPAGKFWGPLAGEFAKKAIHAVTELPSDELESKGMLLLQSGFVKDTMLDIAGKALCAKGLAVELEDVIFMQAESGSSEKAGEGHCVKKKIELSEELEETLLCAMASWMKSLLQQNGS